MVLVCGVAFWLQMGKQLNQLEAFQTTKTMKKLENFADTFQPCYNSLNFKNYYDNHKKYKHLN